MAKPKLFIGSSEAKLTVANALNKGLKKCADVTIWNKGVFKLNEGFLETLEDKPKEYDLAVFIFAPDDTTTSKNETKPSTRDNVIFESGLFMGVLGRERVFIVYDEAAGLKIPSDFAGVTLASYNGSLIKGTDASAAVESACRLIQQSINGLKVKHLDGEWTSRYRKADEEGQPLIEEDVTIRTCGDQIHIKSKGGKREDDFYEAKGEMPQDGHILGKWVSHAAESCDTSGIFVLAINSASNFMCGYFTSPGEMGGVKYADWILAKKTGADKATVSARLKKAQKTLTEMTTNISSGVS
jgi:hypothetical protein